MAVYKDSSPWKFTRVEPNYLGYYNHITIEPYDDDLSYTILPQYNYRPDLLAYDIYGDAKLWWVFASRNMDRLKDPIFDFRSGLEIRLPKKSTLNALLGT